MNEVDLSKFVQAAAVQKPPGSGIIVAINGQNMPVEAAQFTLLAEIVSRLDRIVAMLEKMAFDAGT